eukprot:1045150_1
MALQDARREDLLLEITRLKQQLNSSIFAKAIQEQKLKHLTQLVKENTREYRSVVSQNECLQSNSLIAEKSLLKYDQTMTNYIKLQNDMMTMGQTINELQHNNQSLSSANREYMQEKQSLLNKNRQLQMDNARLQSENTKYEEDRNTMQGEWTETQHTIYALRAEIEELKQTLEFRSDTVRSGGIYSIQLQSSDSLTPQTPTFKRAATNSTTKSKTRLPQFHAFLSPPDHDPSERKANYHSSSTYYVDMTYLEPAISANSDNEEVYCFWLAVCDSNGVTSQGIEYNRLYPWLCKVFIENTGCSRVPKSSDLELVFRKKIIKNEKKTDKNADVFVVKYTELVTFWNWFKESCEIVKELAYLWDFNDK